MNRHRFHLLLLTLACIVFGWASAARAYQLENVRWPDGTQITINLLLAEPGRTLLDGNTSWNQVAVDATNVWNSYLGSGVQFQSNYDYLTPVDGDGRNSVFFSDTIYGESFGSDTLAVTLLDRSGATLTETDVIVNHAKAFDSYRGDLRRTSANVILYDLRRILIHEFGHVLGLAHAPDSAAIMYAYVSNVDTVQSDDIAGVQAIYGVPVRQPAIANTNAFARANEAFVYNVAATGGKLTYAAGGLPAGLQINPTSGTISGTASVSGVYAVALTVTNSVGTARATLTLTVGTPPVITSATTVTALLGLPFYYQITATGNPTGYGPFTVFGSGLTYNQTAGVISGIPTAIQPIYGAIAASNGGGTGGASLFINVAYDLSATNLSTLHNSDFIASDSALTLGTDGNFYGTSSNGIIRVSPDGAATLLCRVPTLGTPYQQTLNAGLILGADGNFYGASYDGGANGQGSFFRLTPAGGLTQLYEFTDNDGGRAQSAPILGRDGNFYGTLHDRSIGKDGTVYRLTPAGVLTILHRFASVVDGSGPSGLIQAADGNLYGTTVIGGPAGGGTVFQITPGGALTTIHTFADTGISYPAGTLVKGMDGNLYGTTVYGFVPGAASYSNSTTFFRVVPGGGFVAIRTLDGADGSYPGAFTLGPDGLLYGVGSKNYGVGDFSAVFGKYALDGTYTVIHRYAVSESPGSRPPVVGANGSFYSVTENYNFVRIVPDAASGGVTYVSVQATATNASAAGQQAVLTLSRGGSGDTSRDLTVHLTYNGSARPGLDYPAQPDTVVIPAGSTAVSLVISALAQAESGSLNVHVAAAQGYTVNPNASVVSLQVSGTTGAMHPAFTAGEVALSNGAYYLAFSNGNPFGYYSYLSESRYLYHFDMGYEYWFDANDGQNGVYLYDFASNTFFYTSPTFPFPYLYDFGLDAVLYYYPDPNKAGRYNTNGTRYFYNFATGQIITK